MTESMLHTEAIATVEQDPLLSRVGNLVIAMRRRAAVLGMAAILVAGCGDDDGVTERKQQAIREAAQATASAVEEYNRQQAAGPEADARGKDQMQEYVFGEGRIAATIFDDLEREGNRFTYNGPDDWRWSNAAADDDSRQTVVSARFENNMLTIEKQARVKDKIVRVGAMCSLPGYANTPSTFNTKTEISNWITGKRGEDLRVERLYADFDPPEAVGGEVDLIEIIATYIENGDFESLTFNGAQTAPAAEQFAESFGIIGGRWEAIADKAATSCKL